MRYPLTSASDVLSDIIYRMAIVTKITAAASDILKTFAWNVCNTTFYWKIDVFQTALQFQTPEAYCSMGPIIRAH